VPETAADLLFRPAIELAGLVRRGEVTSRELVEASLERIDALNGDLNAFIHVYADAALDTADAVGPGDERPFAGVPIAIKDVGPPEAGRPITFGSQLFGDFVARIDGNVTSRLRDAGFVAVGKTNAPEMGILPVTEPRRYGPTRNPWDRERTPGGSSGGSASATAAGMVPIGHANDGGGSIRIPAACCGLVGLKPARGRVSPAPLQGDSFLAIDGVVSHTVADTAAVLDVLEGYVPGDSTWAPPPAEPFAAAAAREPGRLRIAVTTLSPIEAPIDPVASGSVMDAAALLDGLGHEVVEVDPPWRVDDIFPVFSKLWEQAIGMTVDFGRLVSGQQPSPELCEKLTLDLYERALATNAIDVARATIQLEVIGRTAIAWMLGEQFDAIVTPALAQRPLPIGSLDAEKGYDTLYESALFTPYTAFANLSGQPAISLPLFQGADGLPIGIHFIGRPADEATLLALATQLETAHPWADRRPALAG
jgi:amidase